VDAIASGWMRSRAGEISTIGDNLWILLAHRNVVTIRHESVLIHR
jgi:hypothetical protein